MLGIIILLILEKKNYKRGAFTNDYLSNIPIISPKINKN